MIHACFANEYTVYYIPLLFSQLRARSNSLKSAFLTYGLISVPSWYQNLWDFRVFIGLLNRKNKLLLVDKLTLKCLLTFWTYQELTKKFYARKNHSSWFEITWPLLCNQFIPPICCRHLSSIYWAIIILMLLFIRLCPLETSSYKHLWYIDLVL